MQIIDKATGIWRFYRDGFRSMTVGRTLWIVIAIKLAVIFLVIKLFFMPDRMSRDYESDSERAAAVRSALCEKTDTDLL